MFAFFQDRPDAEPRRRHRGQHAVLARRPRPQPAVQVGDQGGLPAGLPRQADDPQTAGRMLGQLCYNLGFDL